MASVIVLNDSSRLQGVSSCAGLDTFRIGSVIGGTLVTGAKAEALYNAIEELAGDGGSIALLSKAEAAVNTSKVVLALNSVRKALQVRRRPCPESSADCARAAQHDIT
jgi:hypothetical protein